MQNILGGVEAVSIQEPVDAADTAGATSAWIACSQYQGLLVVVLHVGVLSSTSLDWSVRTATDGSGTGAVTLTPVDGALTQVTSANDDPNIQIARFDARSSLGFIQTIGTIVGAGGALIASELIALPTY